MAINATNYDGTKDYKIAEVGDIENRTSDSFDLWAGTSDRRLQYSVLFQNFNYTKIGKLVFFVMAIRATPSEGGEKAQIKANLFTKYPPIDDIFFPCIIAENTMIDGGDQDTIGRLLGDRIYFAGRNGFASDVMWSVETEAYLRLSGIYICK